MGDLPLYLVQEEEWSQMLLLYDSAIKEISTKLEILNNEFKLSHQYNPIEHISSRLKSMDSIARKLRKRDRELTVANVMGYVNDVAGLRVICSFSQDIYRIARAIERQSDIEILKIKDYIKEPKPNGYMSYHMIVTVPIFLSDRVIKTKVEIQIRTIAMDFWASLEHKIYYKFEGNAPQGIRAELKECADIVAYLDKKMLSINEKVREYAEKGSVSDMTIDADYDEAVSDDMNIIENEADNNEKALKMGVNPSVKKSVRKEPRKRKLWR
ncbi:MAG: GTP pyrophosphokinase family protein [Lachnospiraceae bacterium]|nr:GTP pyrophosphokinase family protein [Lachnospiraceae bacterium]